MNFLSRKLESLGYPSRCTSHRRNVYLFVCPFVRLSVTPWHSMKTTQDHEIFTDGPSSTGLA